MMKSAITTTMILASTGVYADKYSTSDMSYSDALFTFRNPDRSRPRVEQS